MDENFMAKQASKQTSRYQQNVLIKGDRAFYIGDNDEQKQMKLRKFSLDSGEQLAGAPFRDFTRAATFDDDGRTLVVLGFADTI